MGKFSRIEVSFELSILRHQAFPIYARTRTTTSTRTSFSIKNDRFLGITENTMVQVPANCARKNDSFKVASLLDQIFHLVSVRDPDHVLFDDWGLHPE